MYVVSDFYLMLICIVWSLELYELVCVCVRVCVCPCVPNMQMTCYGYSSGDNVEEVFLETAKKIYQNIQDGK